MKIPALVFLAFFSMSATGWLTNFEEAQEIANSKHRLILLNFSGSDWCGPCIRLKREIFESKMFEDFADTNLVLVNADFPRSSKNKLNKDQVRQNESLAERYNAKGKFPLTLLLSAEGKILKVWDGLPNKGAVEFVQQLKLVCNARQ
jgi:thioredoxin-related protein